MRFKFLLAIAIFSFPLVALVPGCTGADNPKIADAPPPPPAKPEETAPRIRADATGKKVEYGSNDRYKKAMDRLNK